MNETQNLLRQVLDGLQRRPGVVGAALVTRDGIRVADAWRKELWNRETFSAMSATLMGAAEVALSDLGGARARRVITETSQHRMVVVGATDELVLVTLSGESLALDELLAAVDEAAGQVARVLGRESPTQVVKRG